MNTLPQNSVVNICRSFPELATGKDGVTKEILRDSYLESIDTTLSSETELLVVEGDEGVGKTTLLSQFVRYKYPTQCISLFLRPLRWLCDPEAIKSEICNQINYLLKGEEFPNRCAISDSQLSYLFSSLQSKARNSKLNYYFIIDGLNNISDQDAITVKKMILELFPFGYKGFKFLVSGGKFENDYFRTKLIFKPLLVGPFTSTESESYLNQFALTESQVAEISNTCKNNPGKLSSIARILEKTDINMVENFIRNLPDNLPQLFAIEWQEAVNESNKLILALLAFQYKPLSLEEIATITNQEINYVSEQIKGINFLVINELNHIYYISNSFRRFACNQLKDYENIIADLILNFFTHDPDNPDTFSFLPKYLVDAGKDVELLEFLTPNLFKRMLQKSESLSYVRENSRLGYLSALKLNRDKDVFGYSVQNSNINSIEKAEVWKSEVRAYLSLAMYDEAVYLAQSNVLKEERMLLLAVIAKYYKQKGFEIPPEIKDSLHKLKEEIEFSYIKDKVFEISTELVYSFPDLAISLIEKSMHTSPDENALDLAYVRLSMQAFSASDDNYKQIASSLNSKIKNTDLKTLTSGIAEVVGDCSPEVLINIVEHIKDTSNQIIFLRQWLLKNKCHERAYEVVKYSLKKIIDVMAYAPNTTVLREIATPLPHVKDIKILRELVKSFDMQQENILGSTVEYVRLQLILIESELLFDVESAKERLIRVFCHIEEIPELDIKAECLIWMLGLKSLEHYKAIEKKEGVFLLSNQSFEDALSKIIDNTADHLKSLEGIVETLANYNLNYAKDLVSKFNIQPRRDYGYLKIIKSLKDLISNYECHIIKDIVESISNNHIQSEALEIIAEYAADNLVINTYKSYLLESIHLLDPEAKCRVLCLILKSSPENKYIQDKLKTVWGEIDLGWNQINVGFKMVAFFSDINPELAMDFMESTQSLKEQYRLHSNTVAFTYTTTMLLILRSVSGLLPHLTDVSKEIDQLGRFIERIPSRGKQIELWSELAYRVSDCNIGESERISLTKVIPLLDALKDIDQLYYEKLVINISPILFKIKQSMGLRYIRSISSPQKDFAYANVCYSILTKTHYNDPYKTDSDSVFNISYEEILDVIEICNQIDVDYIVYQQIVHIVESVKSKRNKYTYQRIVNIIQSLKNLANNKFPSNNYIQHPGYQLASLANIAQLEKKPNWDSLIGRIKKDIRNISDRCYVLLITAKCMSRKQRERAVKLINETLEDLELIPSMVDRIDRYEFMAEITSLIDLPLSKKVIKKAMELSVRLPGENNISTQKRLIDLAYTINPDMATSLASIVDNDPARVEEKFKLKEKVKMLETKTRIEKATIDDFKDIPISWISDACWKLLADLNANKASHRHFHDLYKYFDIINETTMSHAYPILAWIIENLNRRYKNEQGFSFLRSIYQNLLVCLDLTWSLIICASRMETGQSFPRYVSMLNIGIGERERALEKLNQWFQINSDEYIKICDPYFSPSDLEILRLILNCNPKCKIYILTSLGKHKELKMSEPWEEYYRHIWKSQVWSELPYFTELVLVGIEPRDDFPIHDRWIISNKAGLRVGTSLSSVGISKISEISPLTIEEKSEKEIEIDDYLFKQKRYNSARVRYRSISL